MQKQSFLRAFDFLSLENSKPQRNENNKKKWCQMIFDPIASP